MKVKLERPATLGLAVVAAGPRGVPTRPEVRLIGRIEKPKTVRKKETPACGLGSGKVLTSSVPILIICSRWPNLFFLSSSRITLVRFLFFFFFFLKLRIGEWQVACCSKTTSRHVGACCCSGKGLEVCQLGPRFGLLVELKSRRRLGKRRRPPEGFLFSLLELRMGKYSERVQFKFRPATLGLAVVAARASRCANSARGLAYW